MDKIIGYSDDELVVKILSFLPTKLVVSTSILSKQWKFLWMRVPKLKFDDHKFPYGSWESEEIHRFIAMNLPLTPVIESLCLSFHTPPFKPEDIKSWVEIAISRCVLELSISCFKALLPSSLYTCKSLVILKLSCRVLVDVPREVCLPSLKTLHLRRAKYTNEESLQRLLSNCCVLQNLIVERCVRDNLRKLVLIIPSLLSLCFEIPSSFICDEYVIDTPSLKYFKFTDYSHSSSYIIVNMSKLVEADLTLRGLPHIKKLLERVTSVKRLSLSLLDNSAEAVYGDDIVFNELEHLKFHISYTNWSKSLLWLLKSTPKLRDFEFDGNRSGWDTSVCWKRMIDAPQCLLSSLQTFKCTTCNNPSREEIDMAKYILRKSCRLRTATFLIGRYLDPQKKRRIKDGLVNSSRGSTTCNLIFE